MSAKKRVAQRWAAQRSLVAAGSEQDIESNLPSFEKAYAEFKRAVEDGVSRGLSGDHTVVRRWANRPWVQLMDRGYEIAEGILGSRAVPSRDAKGIEMAHRLYARSQKMPEDVYKWWKTNEKRLLLTIEAAKTWPVKEEGSDDLFRVGPFLVHNGLGTTGPQLDAFKKMLETAIKKVKGLRGVPGFQKVLYGDIYLVGQIRGAHHAAWYNVSEDAIYCRLSKSKWGFDEAYALVHELAHRYWRRFMSPLAKAKWESHHSKVLYTKVDLPMPQAGDPLPVRVKGSPRGWRPKVESLKGGNYFYRSHDGVLLSIPERRIRRVVDQNKGVALRFPTPYSSTNEEEHFCEAVASDAFGKLSEKHQEALDSIFKERAVAASVSVLSGIHRYEDFIGETGMSRRLTASDRTRLIKLASSMEKGSPERKAILAGLDKTPTTKSAASPKMVVKADAKSIDAAMRFGDPEDTGWSQWLNVQDAYPHLKAGFDRASDWDFHPTPSLCRWVWYGKTNVAFLLEGDARMTYEIKSPVNDYKVREELKALVGIKSKSVYQTDADLYKSSIELVGDIHWKTLYTLEIGDYPEMIPYIPEKIMEAIQKTDPDGYIDLMTA